MIGRQPWGLFVDINNTVYIADKGTSRILVWLEGYMAPSRTISGELSESYAIFATLNGDIYVDNGKNYTRIDLWTSNSTNSTVFMNVSESCYGLFVDINDNLYCSVTNYHHVVRRALSKGSNTTTAIIAGNGTRGSTATMLSEPRGVFVDVRFTLYVADCGNSRIQLFQYDQLNGTTVPINLTIALNCPTGIVLDADGYLFISDIVNNRIIGSGPDGFRCIAGCSRVNGSGSDQLFYPQSLSFDTYGNIFVADSSNDRIQKFLLSKNTCSKYLEIFLFSDIKASIKSF